MTAIMTISTTSCSERVPEFLLTDPVEPVPAGERELVAKLAAGQAAAFEELVRRFGGRMLATARRLLRQEDDAHDAVQDAFLSAFKAIDQFAGDAKLSTWLHRITVNAALMKLRGRRRRPEQSIDDLLPAFDEHGEWMSGSPTWHASTHELLEGAEMRSLVRACIDRLPEAYRSVLLLRDIEDFDTAEVAAMLGTTSNAVKIRLHRARQALRTLVEREQQAAEDSHGK